MSPTPQAGARWVCCHLGAREHYAVPRALHRRHRLHRLITDAWVRPGSLWSRLPGELPRRLSERFHPELADADVRGFTLPLMAQEAVWRTERQSGWRRAMDRNVWFERRAVDALRGLDDRAGPGTILFAHSYSARAIFRHAKSRGWTTVLGQIDPGEAHFQIVRRVSEELQEYGGTPGAPPPAYFEAWHEECTLADWIVVNSEWSREALRRSGVAGENVRVIPLAYEPGPIGLVAPREYPPAFTAARPLRVLFVGHVSVAKGMPALLGAITQMAHAPLTLRVVGESAMAVPPRFRDHPAIAWVGPVSRSDVMRHYRECDVLVFPSHSDGFGIALVEAQAWRLPIVASRCCGHVVQDGVNGILLPEVSAGAITAALTRLIESPRLLAEFSRHAGGAQAVGVDALSVELLRLEHA